MYMECCLFQISGNILYAYPVHIVGYRQTPLTVTKTLMIQQGLPLGVSFIAYVLGLLLEEEYRTCYRKMDCATVYVVVDQSICYIIHVISYVHFYGPFTGYNLPRTLEKRI